MKAMNQELITEDGTYWDSDGEAIKLLHINEQWPLWLTKQDLETMLGYLDKMEDKEQVPDAVVRCDCGTAYLSAITASMCPECGY